MSMDKPTKPYPLSPASMPSFFPPQLLDPSIRGESFDQLLENRGIRFIHRQSVPCFNLTDLEQNSHDPLCHICDGAGIYYYREKEIYGLFHSNTLDKAFEHHGVWEVGQALVTLPTEYADGTQAEFNTMDQLLIPDFTVRMWELKEYIPNVHKTQSVRYPIEKTDFLGSYVNGAVKTYLPGVDFTINTNGDIQWIAGHEPMYNTMIQKGEIYAVSYYANPVYTVIQHLRELRITQEMQPDFTKVAKRLPQSILVRRDYLRNSPEKEGQ